MNRKVLIYTLLAVMVIAGLGSGGYSIYKNKFSASTNEASTTIAKPATGLSIKVVAKDGKTLLGAARVGIIAADITNPAVRSKLNVSVNDRGATVDEMDKYTGNNKSQDVLVGTGVDVLKAISEISSVYMISNDTGTFNIPNASDPDHSHHGMSYFDEKTFASFDQNGKIIKQFVPIRIYVE